VSRARPSEGHRLGGLEAAVERSAALKPCSHGASPDAVRSVVVYVPLRTGRHVRAEITCESHRGEQGGRGAASRGHRRVRLRRATLPHCHGPRKHLAPKGPVVSVSAKQPVGEGGAGGEGGKGGRGGEMGLGGGAGGSGGGEGGAGGEGGGGEGGDGVPHTKLRERTTSSQLPCTHSSRMPGQLGVASYQGLNQDVPARRGGLRRGHGVRVTRPQPSPARTPPTAPATEALAFPQTHPRALQHPGSATRAP
jgi:hypothetical protein